MSTTEFLDKTGLEYYNSKLDTKFAEKQDKLTAGTGISISDENVISATEIKTITEKTNIKALTESGIYKIDTVNNANSYLYIPISSAFDFDNIDISTGATTYNDSFRLIYGEALVHVLAVDGSTFTFEVTPTPESVYTAKWQWSSSASKMTWVPDAYYHNPFRGKINSDGYYDVTDLAAAYSAGTGITISDENVISAKENTISSDFIMGVNYIGTYRVTKDVTGQLVKTTNISTGAITYDNITIPAGSLYIGNIADSTTLTVGDTIVIYSGTKITTITYNGFSQSGTTLIFDFTIVTDDVLNKQNQLTGLTLFNKTYITYDAQTIIDWGSKSADDIDIFSTYGTYGMGFINSNQYFSYMNINYDVTSVKGPALISWTSKGENIVFHRGKYIRYFTIDDDSGDEGEISFDMYNYLTEESMPVVPIKLLSVQATPPQCKEEINILTKDLNVSVCYSSDTWGTYETLTLPANTIIYGDLADVTTGQKTIGTNINPYIVFPDGTVYDIKKVTITAFMIVQRNALATIEDIDKLFTYLEMLCSATYDGSTGASAISATTTFKIDGADNGAATYALDTSTKVLTYTFANNGTSGTDPDYTGTLQLIVGDVTAGAQYTHELGEITIAAGSNITGTITEEFTPVLTQNYTFDLYEVKEEV